MPSRFRRAVEIRHATLTYNAANSGDRAVTRQATDLGMALINTENEQDDGKLAAAVAKLGIEIN